MRTLQRINQTGLILASILVLITLKTGLAAEQKATDTSDKAVRQEESSETHGTVVDPGYVYDPTGKTDPFFSFLSLKKEQEEEEDQLTELETMELSQLDLVIIVVSPSDRWAMVKDSKDVGHVIKEGTLIGTNGGIVYKIEKGQVVIREEYVDFRGEKQYREIIKESPSL
ncbi:MAG TPA: pilus assembly protein PilP [Desulfatiglandales bacterium]|nr:pilus assembly protein PilP [Desulfatiglandales bacterium]